MGLLTTIAGFKPGKPYSLELANGKTFTTDQYAIVAHGNAEKPWPFSACSDSKFTEGEFQRYLETLNKERLRVPKRAWLHQKLDDINRFIDVQWTDEVLQGKFARQREMEKRTDPANAVKIKIEAILKRKGDAEEAGDDEEVNRCEAELIALANNASTNGSGKGPSPMKPKTAAVQSVQDRLALQSQKIRGKNSEDVRKALLVERRKLKAERERAGVENNAKKQAERDAARLAAAAGGDGLLAVPGGGGKAMMRELFGDSPGTSRAGTPFSGASTPLMRRSRAGTPMNGVKKESGLGKIVKQASASGEDELAGLDLGIDVEI